MRQDRRDQEQVPPARREAGRADDDIPQAKFAIAGKDTE
jgi:hypothetical protein